MAQMSPFCFLFRQTQGLEFKEENRHQQLILHFFAQEPPKIASFPKTRITWLNARLSNVQMNRRVPHLLLILSRVITDQREPQICKYTLETAWKYGLAHLLQASKALLNKYTVAGKKQGWKQNSVFPLKEIFPEFLSSASEASEDIGRPCGTAKGKILDDKLGNGWWFKREDKWLYQNTTNGSKEKRREESQWTA